MKWLGYKTFTSSAIHNKLNSVVAGRLGDTNSPTADTAIA